MHRDDPGPSLQCGELLPLPRQSSQAPFHDQTCPAISRFAKDPDALKVSQFAGLSDLQGAIGLLLIDRPCRHRSIDVSASFAAHLTVVDFGYIIARAQLTPAGKKKREFQIELVAFG